MKKLVIFVVIMMLVSLLGCNANVEPEVTTAPADDITAEPTPEPTPEPTEEPTPSPTPEPTPVPYGPYSATDASVFEFPHTMMKEKDFEVVAENIRAYDERYAILSIKAINTGSKDLDINISGIAINGCRVQQVRGIFMSVPAGKDSITGLWLDFDTAKLYDIQSITDIKFSYLIQPSGDIYTNVYMGVATLTSDVETVPFEIGGMYLIESGKYIDVYLYDAGINEKGYEYFELLIHNKSKYIEFYLIESLIVSDTAITYNMPRGGTLSPGTVCIIREDRNRGAKKLLDDESNINKIEILITGHNPFDGNRGYTIDAVYEADN